MTCSWVVNSGCRLTKDSQSNFLNTLESSSSSSRMRRGMWRRAVAGVDIFIHPRGNLKFINAVCNEGNYLRNNAARREKRGSLLWRVWDDDKSSEDKCKYLSSTSLLKEKRFCCCCEKKSSADRGGETSSIVLDCSLKPRRQAFQSNANCCKRMKMKGCLKPNSEAWVFTLHYIARKDWISHSTENVF